MILRIRTHPIDIFLLTGDEAKDARKAADCEEVHGGFAFVTSDFGHNGFVWNTAEEFESDWQISFGELTSASPPSGRLAILVKE